MHVLKALALILLTFQLASTAPLLGPPPPPPPSGNTGGNDTDDQKACEQLIAEMAQQFEELALAAGEISVEQLCLITALSFIRR